jgi:predicted dehydrogenase
MPDDKAKENLVKEVVQPFYKDSWFNPVFHEDYDKLKDKIKDYGFDSVEQLVRWRCTNQTGGGLMAELGSHQLDACSIFLGHVHPIAVTGVGGKYFYGRPPSDGETNSYGFSTNYNDRDCDDHVSLTYEFPGKNHPRGPARPDGSHGTDANDIVLVTYTSINTNGFENYGECVTGTRGTMVVEKEEAVLLYTESNPNGKTGDPRALTVKVDPAGTGKPALDSSSTWGAAGSSLVAGAGPAGGALGVEISRGYKEEIEDFAFCVRQWQKGLEYSKQRLPRCPGPVALVDAVIALTANQAMQKRQRIEFKDAWFDPKAPEVPDGDTTPKIPVA